MYNKYLAMTILLTAFFNVQAALQLPDTNLCNSNSYKCDLGCMKALVGGRGICIHDQCYCTDEMEFGKCEDDNHEMCDALCQDLSSDLIGFCMGEQCNCLS
ncbi:hypothetical protein K501DRAFT_284877 [Backusella circina FSU 941]|nr:hypothetical protein K501DRAFT_284877 [Backusella circina FSU 941]